jgi:hypothetical protein
MSGTQCGGGSLSPSPLAGGGTILRNAYTRSKHSRRAHSRKSHVRVPHADVRGSHVPATRITDQGAPGKWSSKHGPGISVTHPGSLKSVGYSV